MVHIGNTVLGDGTVKICIPLAGKNREVLAERMREVTKAAPDLIEWRMDSLEEKVQEADISGIFSVIREKAGNIPVLCTMRTAAEGGNCRMSEGEYCDFYERLCKEESPDAVDVEIISKQKAAAQIISAAHERNIPVIGSCHDFSGTPRPEEILKVLETMEKAGADIVKMAVMPHSAEDADIVFEAAARYRMREAHRPYIVISMGEFGKRTRVEAPGLGAAMCFATAGGISSAPGQIPADELRRIWKKDFGARQ